MIQVSFLLFMLHEFHIQLLSRFYLWIPKTYLFLLNVSVVFMSSDYWNSSLDHNR